MNPPRDQLQVALARNVFDSAESVASAKNIGKARKLESAAIILLILASAKDFRVRLRLIKGTKIFFFTV